MHPVTTVYLGVCRYWRLGNRYNRFFTSLGIDLPISPPQYQIIYNGPMLAEVSDKYLKHREPGGLMLGLGFLFGLHH